MKLCIYYEFKHTPNKTKYIIIYHLWYNDGVKADGIPIFYKTTYDKGIFYSYMIYLIYKGNCMITKYCIEYMKYSYLIPNGAVTRAYFSTYNSPFWQFSN